MPESIGDEYVVPLFGINTMTWGLGTRNKRRKHVFGEKVCGCTLALGPKPPWLRSGVAGGRVTAIVRALGNKPNPQETSTFCVSRDRSLPALRLLGSVLCRQCQVVTGPNSPIRLLRSREGTPKNRGRRRGRHSMENNDDRLTDYVVRWTQTRLRTSTFAIWSST